MRQRAGLEIRQAGALAMTGELGRAIALLRLTNAGLLAEVEAQAATNPLLCVTPPVPGWLHLLAQPAPGREARRPALPAGAAAGGAGAGGAAEAAAAAPGLTAHVMAQLGLVLRDPADRPLALAFVAALEPSGWLGADVAAIAAACATSRGRAEAVLARLQQMEPAGLFARSLAECLRLQAADRGILDARFGLLLDNLPLLASGDLDAVARRCGCDRAEVAAMLARLRRLDPKPGAAFGDAVPLREPDLIVRRTGQGWTVELNRSNLPAVEVIEPAGGEGEGEGGADDLRAARWLVRAVARRNATTLRIARSALAHQIGFVTGGAAELRPLSPADLARRTGLHVSTISRVTAGLMVDLPRGTVALRDFFSAAAPGAAAAEVSTAALRAEMARLVAAEDPARPLSDAAIAAHFAARGVPLARRTVAKYRLMLRIPASADRARAALIDPARAAQAGRPPPRA